MRLLYVIMYLKTMIISIDQGKVQITKGVLGQKTEILELVRVTDVGLERTFMNRITGDGTLVLSVQHQAGRAPEIRLTGIARIEQLNELLNQLRNLIFVLRSGNWDKGIIY